MVGLSNGVKIQRKRRENYEGTNGVGDHERESIDLSWK